MATPASTAADVLVIFGITGDLAKKMTFRSLYRLERRRMLQCPIVGVARDEWSAATLRDHARRAIEDSGERCDEDVLPRAVRCDQSLRRPGGLGRQARQGRFHRSRIAARLEAGPGPDASRTAARGKTNRPPGNDRARRRPRGRHGHLRYLLADLAKQPGNGSCRTVMLSGRHTSYAGCPRPPRARGGRGAAVLPKFAVKPPASAVWI